MTGFRTLLIIAVIALGGIAVAGAGGRAGAQETTEAVAQIVPFDVAENATRFVVDEAFVDASGLPVRGATFIAEGYIYPPGTLGENNGVLADGSPEFPELVVGRWISRGWVTEDLATVTTGPFLATQHLYIFDVGDESFSFVSNGEEMIDPGVAIVRPVTGGSGPLSSAGGQIEQTLLGFNATGGLNLHFEAHLTFVEVGFDLNNLLMPAAGAGSPVAEATPTAAG